MSEINCGIIKDLLPLYVDNVCSNETKDVVEEHINECNSCSEYCSSLKNAPTLPALDSDIDKAVVKVGKRMKKHTKKAVVRVVCIIASILLVVGIFAFLTIPLALAKDSYNRTFLAMQTEHIDLLATNKQEPNFNGKYGSLYIDDSFGKYTVENHTEDHQQLVFEDGRKISFLRYNGEDVPAQYFQSYIAQEYNPFVTTHLPFLIPVIEKGAEQLGFTFDDIDRGDLRVFKTLADTPCYEVEGYFKECAYFYLYEIVMPFTNGALMVAEGNNCEGYGYTLYNENGTTHMVETQLKGNIDVRTTIVFIGFSEEEVVKLFASYLIAP
ncbi:MAG: zf-HC2 domain-containing protein [Clostridia bacterium]|nr:zf-HC2 domain-containing protein [Clostridia bacterium]